MEAGGAGGWGRDLKLWIDCEVNHATGELVGTSVCTVLFILSIFVIKVSLAGAQCKKF